MLDYHLRRITRTLTQVPPSIESVFLRLLEDDGKPLACRRTFFPENSMNSLLILTGQLFLPLSQGH